MRRVVTIGSVVVTAMLAGGLAASAEPVALGAGADCPPVVAPGAQGGRPGPGTGPAGVPGVPVAPVPALPRLPPIPPVPVLPPPTVDPGEPAAPSQPGASAVAAAAQAVAASASALARTASDLAAALARIGGPASEAPDLGATPALGAAPVAGSAAAAGPPADDSGPGQAPAGDTPVARIVGSSARRVAPDPSPNGDGPGSRGGPNRPGPTGTGPGGPRNAQPSAPGPGSAAGADPAPSAPGPGGAPGADPAPTATDPCLPGQPGQPGQPAGTTTSAAAAHGWGTPNRSDDFATRIGDGWSLYDGPGHVGNGRRSPSAATVSDGALDITGDPNGTTEGMAWGKGQQYGRWEARVKVPAGDPTYHAVMLLWPDAENWPVGGEVDFMEISDPARQNADMFLHYGASNSQKHGSVTIDATQWHDWAVEWTPGGITAFVDGREWWKTTDTSILPPGPMHLTLQLDWFPHGGGSVQTSHMYVDWVRQYPYTRGGSTGTGEGAADAVSSAVHAATAAAGGVAGIPAAAGGPVAGAVGGAVGGVVQQATAALTEGAPDARPGLVPRAVAVP